MKYRIMIKTATGNKDQYQFLTFINVNGETEIWETDSLIELDKQVEKMLNGNYRKCDIQLVSPLDFTVFADVYDNDKYPPEPEPEPETEISITDITRTVTDEETIVTAVEFTAVGENLPEDEEYTWVFAIDGNTIEKTSTSAVLRVEDENKDALAGVLTATVRVGNYASPEIAFE